MNTFTEDQIRIAQTAAESKIFLSGPVGSGKTTIGKAFLQTLLEKGIPGSRILILVPQRSLGLTYQDFLSQLSINGSMPISQTFGGLAQRAIRLFWPIIAPMTRFAAPQQQPSFLTLETAQYYLTKVCEPYFESGYFESIRAEKPRILSQILDNLNKAALVGFSYQDIATKLVNAWNQEPAHSQAFYQAQECAIAFRDYCYQHNLLDFSLQYEIFNQTLWPSLICRENLTRSYDYILYDQIEEDVPVSHDILKDWLASPSLNGSLLLMDIDGGYRTFLGADPESGYSLLHSCDTHIQVSGSWVTSPSIQNTAKLLNAVIHKEAIPPLEGKDFSAISYQHNEYFPLMMDAVTDSIETLLATGCAPGEIVVMAPFVSDAFRFQFTSRMEARNIPVVSNRPSRSLREETVTHVFLTWAKIANPQWGIKPSPYEVRTAIHQSVYMMDPIRADMITRMLFHPRKEFWLDDINEVRADTRERITQVGCDAYQAIREWLLIYQSSQTTLDVFFSRLFGELLSQPGFGYHNDYSSANTASKLIESVQKFRRATLWSFKNQEVEWAKEYVEMVETGILAALYLESWETPPMDAVYLSPAYTFLMQNRPVSYQFWLDIGSMGWWQRLLQPLTQPYVLSRHWNPQAKWTDMQEYETNQENMGKLVNGLLSRCRSQVFLHTCGYNERGEEERGPLIQTIQRMLRHTHPTGIQKNV
ncbi:MAG: hypothetical protein CVU39_05310 [Chloroflexi bacterium HGW-Chloroflexi-10]|nr:MAG: hypothetical protein CVU39_05310 [Chloroflexi bacterium HGW-Chloroflexi-10]